MSMNDSSAEGSAPLPYRVQRRRSPGWKMPANTVYVGRPTVLGNYHPGSRWDDDEWVLGRFHSHRECSVACYRHWLLGTPEFMTWWRGTLWGCTQGMVGDPMRKAALAKIPSLRGKNLACWCPLPTRPYEPDECHAAVLLEIANASPAIKKASP